MILPDKEYTGMGILFLQFKIFSFPHLNPLLYTADEHMEEKNILCPFCNSENRGAAKFCRSCGRVIERDDDFLVCSRCNSKVKFPAKYCYRCGFNLRKGVKKPDEKKRIHVASATRKISDTKKPALSLSGYVKEAISFVAKIREFYDMDIDELRNLLNYQQYIYENFPGGLALIEREEGAFISVNSAFEELTGFSREELKNKNIISCLSSINPQNKRYSMNTIMERGDFLIFNRDYEKISVKVEDSKELFDNKALLLMLEKSAGEYRWARKKSSVTKQLFLVARIAEEINRSLDLNIILDNTLDRIITATKSDAALIMFMDESKKLRPIASRGISEKFIEDLKSRTISADMGTRAKALLLGKTVEAKSAYIEEGSSFTGALLNTEKLETMVTVPLKTSDEIIGIMSLGRRKRFNYSGKDLELLDAIGNHVVIAVKNSRLYEQVKTQYLTLVSQLPDLVLVHKNEKIVYINPVAKDILGYTCKELADKSILDYINDEDRDMVSENIRKGMAGELTEDYEVSIITKSGIERIAIMRSSLITYENEAALLSVLIDITEIKEVGNKLGQRTLELARRIRELTCLYDMAKLVGRESFSTQKILKNMAKLLSTAFHYKDFIPVKIIVDKKAYATKNFPADTEYYAVDIVIKGVKRGSVRISLRDLNISKEVFCKENSNIINTGIREISNLIERRETEEIKAELQEKLRHADRLATIGKLSAGVAHELNEPLGNILGFAQLVKKSCHMPPQIESDIDKIVSASLYAREVVRKLMLFSRQMPQKNILVDLNQVVNEALYLFEARCEKSNIQLLRFLEEGLPKVYADPAQMTQVLVNLVVNAVQAMSGGGTLTIKTETSEENASLIVEDTGAGMTEDVIKQIFNPFFTTKDIGEGTGLGLSVVHGIVTSHKGVINVMSKPGKGARFEIKLPVAKGN